jgi:dTDP-glucose 4,6-dehydratase
MKTLITGGAGFFGHHLVEHLLKNTDWDIIVLDKLSYSSSGLDRLRDIEAFDENRVKLFACDLTKPITEGVIREIGKIDYIYHVAAESHVDNSIDHPVPFVLNNVASTLNILEFARTQDLKLFVNFSTDEVYGPAPEGKAFKEFEYHYPSNPYAASKSAQEAIGIAYSNTYKVPVITTHTMNLIGERQHPEKFVPKVIRAVLNNETITIHADKTKTKAGTRMYIHCRNVADALLHITKLGYKGYDEWNIAGIEEIDNLTLAQKIAEIVGKPLKYEMTDFHSARPGHDLRYALDSSKLIKSGYKYPMNIWQTLETTIKWTINRREDWL